MKNGQMHKTQAIELPKPRNDDEEQSNTFSTVVLHSLAIIMERTTYTNSSESINEGTMN